MACSFCGESKKIPQLKSKEAKQVADSPGLTILKKMKSTGKEIGRGAYGRVFEVEYGKIHYAAKEVHTILLQYASSEGLQKIKADFLNECHIWDQLQHPCIVQFMGVYYPAKNSLPIIVMEKMEFSLRGLVERYSNIQWEKKLSILNDVCIGLEYLHSRSPPIVHRDLTPNNILLCSHLRAKITDLGVAKVMHTTDTKTLTQTPGTPDFMAPESVASKPIYGLPLDIFSFGGVILYICTQQWPQPAPLVDFDHDTGKRIVKELSEVERRRQYLDKMFGICADMKSLVISCLDDNPKNRPLVGQALLNIKQVKDAYSEKMYCTISPTGEQSTTQVQKQPEKQPKQPSSEQQILQPQKTIEVHNKPSSSASHPSSMPKRPYDMAFKLLLIGDGGSGKTSIFCQYGDAYYNDFISTVGIDYKNKSIEINGKKIKLQIWDTPGQERFRTILPACYRGAVGIMLVFDITHLKSFDNITNWLKDIEMYASSDVELLLVGNNQCDLEYGRVVSYYRAQQMAELQNISYIETNTKTNHNIDEAFEMLVKQILKKKLQKTTEVHNKLSSSASHPSSEVHNKPSSSASHPLSIPERQYDMAFKLLLVGDSDGGKTSILCQYVDDYKLSFIVNFKLKRIEINGKKIMLQIWDTPGQERFRAITTVHYRGAVGIMLVFNITHERTFINITKWLKDIEMYAPSDVEILLVGNNQCDLESERVVSYYRAQQMAESLNISYIETNTKTNHNIDEAFQMLVKQILKKLQKTTEVHNKPSSSASHPSSEVHNKPLSSASHPSSMPKRQYDMAFKLLLIGDKKTSILHQYVDDYCRTPFIGIDYKSKTIEINEKKIKLQIWDTPGQERFHTDTRGAAGIMLVFDITKPKSFDNIIYWLRDIEMDASSDVEVLLVGNNQCDLESKREVSYYRAQQMAESWNISYIEINTKTNHNIDKAFEMLAKQILKKILKKEVMRHQDSLPDLQQQQVQRSKCSQQ